MRLPSTLCAITAIALAQFSSTASAQTWDDNFDSYANGAAVDPGGQASIGNNWESWSSGIGSSTVAGTAPAPAAFSAPNSLSNNPGADTVNNLNLQGSIPTSGKWIASAKVYHPSAYTGRTYFLMLNTYGFGGPYSWSLQTFFDGTQNLVDCDCNNMNSAGGPQILVRDTWSDIEAVIDLDLDTVDVFYNSVSLTDNNGYGWTTGVFGGSTGLLNIQAVDLYPDVPGNPTTTEMYYDDMHLMPEIGDLGANDDNCIQVPNSNGTTATIELIGTGIPGADIAGTVMGGVPGQFGYFITGSSPGLYFVPPGSGGILCIANPQYRYNSVGNMEVFQFDGAGVSQAVVGGGQVILRTDGTGGGGGVPAVMAGECRTFQAWHRDIGGAFGNSNFSQSKFVVFGAGCAGRILSVNPSQAGPGDTVTIDIAGLAAGAHAFDFCIPGIRPTSLSGGLLTGEVMHVDPAHAGPTVLRGAVGTGFSPTPTPVPGLDFTSAEVVVVEVSSPLANLEPGPQLVLNPSPPAATITPWQLVGGDLKATLNNVWAPGQIIEIEIHFNTPLTHCDFYSTRVVISAQNPPTSPADCAQRIADHIQNELSFLAGCSSVVVSVENGDTIVIDIPGAPITNNHQFNKIVII